MAKVIIQLGRFVNKPTIQLVGQYSKATGTIACTREMKNKEGKYDSDFINVETWNGQAQFMEKYFDKGDRINAIGDFRTDTWKDNNGNYKTKTYVVLDSIQKVDWNKTEDDKKVVEKLENEMKETKVDPNELPF